MDKLEIVILDDSPVLFELVKYDKTLKKGVNFVIPANSIVKSVITTTDSEEQLSLEVNSFSSDSNWNNSEILINFNESNTSVILNKDLIWNRGKFHAILETQVDDGGRQTWYSPIILRKGTIA